MAAYVPPIIVTLLTHMKMFWSTVTEVLPLPGR
jgi:hypothetical protein